MNRFWTIVLDPRVLVVIGLAALAAFLFIGADVLAVAGFWAALGLTLILLVWLVVWVVKRVRAKRAAKALEQAIDQQGASGTAGAEDKAQLAVLRERMQEAVKTVKSSRLGELKGAAALYELPWYMVIGNPAAGKSTAVVKSGLKFPFADASGSIIQGIGGTRNCDWFFTSEGILLDTAGRYSVHEEDRSEWLGFLSLLKKNRPKAPINGIVIAASLAELATGRPEQAIQLAKSLRQRVQEVTEHLEVFAPVYLVFTKADLISGFAEFFEDQEREERERVWGATLPYDQAKRKEAIAAFDKHFDELHDGLKELSIARMSLQRGQALPPGVLTFPLEFAALKPALHAFVVTLFEENPYQYQPVFRGFYFTSAVQEGSSTSRASDRVAKQFSLSSRAEYTTAMVVADNGFFLKDLFSKVIFGDKGLVQQYASRRKLRLRAWSFGLGVVVLAAALAGWSWSYLGNRQLMAQVQADLSKVSKMQQERPDLASRLEALELLQDRIEQLQRYREDKPWGISLGLYQGEAIEQKLRAEYFAGIKEVMLTPVSQAIEAYLIEVNANPARLKPMVAAPESAATPANQGANKSAAGGTRYVDASVEDAADAYNALKTYLMLADAKVLEASHMTDQLTRFWRGWLDNNRGAMPREKMIRSAERLISFTTSQLADPAFPQLQNKLALVDQTRENLRELVKGMKGIDRVYSDIKARASTRFAPVTVKGLISDRDRDLVAGSHAVPGAFTREAWDDYVEQAFKDAASKELQSADWVLKTAARNDLTLEGSPDQIRKQLTELYKTEYVKEWQQFMQGITVTEFVSFEVAVERMNRFGDTAESPIRKLMTTLFDQTSWDNPSLINERLGKAQGGVMDWIKQSILRMKPGRVEVDVKVGSDKSAAIPMGPVGREFAALSRIMMSRDSNPALIQGYLQQLSKLRTRFNEIKNQGDPGPGARALMVSTLSGNGSELADALRFVDEQMLNGMTDSARATLRPLLVRPLMQAMAVTVPPAETELNRVWSAQVLEPFQKTLASKYPFDKQSRLEAGPQEIAKVFGPEGAISKFGADALGPMVVRRGDTVVAKTWADIGLRLRPEFSEGFPGWIAMIDGATSGGGGAAGAGGGAQAPSDQGMFQLLPQGSPGIAEYSVVIDGQTLRYRNTTAEWVSMVWPNPAGVAGARVSAITNEGKTIDLLNEPGRSGFDRFVEIGAPRKIGDKLFELNFVQGPYKVTVHIRMIRSPGEAPPAAAQGSAAVVGGSNARLQGLKLPSLVVGSADVPGTAPSAASSAAASGVAQ
ncbi:MAG: type VI secretion system membrane subunit TssM [Ideonella sp.]|nr:type VI secretion system membrane subunit TssM [Ideonella sp.]